MFFRCSRKPVWLLSLCLIFLSGCALLIRTPGYSIDKGSPANGKYRGVFHVHTEFSHDSQATLETVLETAEQAQLDFVIITDHNTNQGKEKVASPDRSEKPLLIIGEEISAPDGHLIALGIDEPAPEFQSSQALVDWIHEKGGYAILAHPICVKKPWKNWNVRNLDGMEVYNFAHSMYPENKFALATKASFLTPKKFLQSLQKTPEEALGVFRSKMRDTPIMAFGATDAHIHWSWLGMTPENFLLAFQSITLYALSDERTAESILHAVGQGKSYIAFEALGSARDFIFVASSSHEHFKSGDVVRAETPIVLSVRVPQAAEIRLLRDGELVNQVVGTELSVESMGPGRYHVEIFKDGRLWILANPIHIYA